VGIIDNLEIPKMGDVLGVVAKNAKMRSVGIMWEGHRVPSAENAECGNNVGGPLSAEY
jgi:hypothetical protein